MKFPPTIRLFLVPCMSLYPDEVMEGYSVQPGSRTICIDPRCRMNMVRLLIHEVLHVQHPSWSERRTIRETRKKFNKMTWKGKAELLKTAFVRAQIGYPPKEEDENA